MTHPRRWALALATVALAGCGSTTHNTTTIVQAATPQQQAAEKVAAKSKVPATTRTQVSLPCPPPPGEGVLGACTPKPVQVFGTSVVPVTVDPPASIPDVSSYQGAVNWSAVKSWQVSHHFTPAGIFKLGEYVLDPYAARNNSQLRSLHMWRAGYWFLRNTGYSHEAAQILAEARYLGLKVVFLDDEVSETRGYDGPVTSILKRAGLIVGEYASPGAYPGGTRSSNPAWIAAYGPANPPAAPWGGPIKAYQCTDGIFGCVTYIPGLGRGDVSVDYGVTKLGVSGASKPCWDVATCAPVQRLICFGPKAHLSNATCARVRSEVAKWTRASKATRNALRRARVTAQQLSQRGRWFDSRIAAARKQYS